MNDRQPYSVHPYPEDSQTPAAPYPQQPYRRAHLLRRVATAIWQNKSSLSQALFAVFATLGVLDDATIVGLVDQPLVVVIEAALFFMVKDLHWALKWIVMRPAMIIVGFLIADDVTLAGIGDNWIAALVSGVVLLVTGGRFAHKAIRDTRSAD
jgi:hypothetical protein